MSQFKTFALAYAEALAEAIKRTNENRAASQAARPKPVSPSHGREGAE